MTTSPTFTYNRDQIIRRALRICNAITSGETPGAQGAQEVSDAADALNAMVSQWQADGLHLWKEKEATLFLQSGQNRYGLGGSVADQAAMDATIVQTSLQANYATGATIIQVASITGIAQGYYIGIMLATGALFWTTVSAPPVSSVSLTAALPGPAIIGAPVFCYQTRVGRPLRIIDARRRLLSSGIDTPLVRMSRLDYREMPNKANTGTVTQFFYDPQLTTGRVWLWPTPQDSLSSIHFTYMEPIYNFNTAADQPDFPVEWVNCLVWNLAEQIGVEYGVSGDRWQRIVAMATQTKDAAAGFDREPESIFLGTAEYPGWR